MTRTMFKVCDKSGKKKWCTTVQKSEALNLLQNNRVNSLLLLFLSRHFKFSVHPCEVCMI